MFQAEKQQIPKGQSRGRTQAEQPAWALGPPTPQCNQAPLVFKS